MSSVDNHDGRQYGRCRGDPIAARRPARPASGVADLSPCDEPEPSASTNVARRRWSAGGASTTFAKAAAHGEDLSRPDQFELVEVNTGTDLYRGPAHLVMEPE